MNIKKLLSLIILTLILIANLSCGFGQDTDNESDNNIDLNTNIDTSTDLNNDTDTNAGLDSETGVNTDDGLVTDADDDLCKDEEKIDTYGNFTTLSGTVSSYDRLKQMKLSAEDYNTGSQYTKEELSKVQMQAKLISSAVLVYPHAAKMMKHYLDGTGENFELDVEEFLNNSIAKENMLKDVNLAIRAAEQIACPKEETTIYQIEESIHHNLTGDWKYSLGSYFTSVELYDVEVKSLLGVTYYSAKMRYVVQDFYNWDKNDTGNVSITSVSPSDLHQLHVNGDAQEFLTYGYAEYEIKWVKGVDSAEIKSLAE